MSQKHLFSKILKFHRLIIQSSDTVQSLQVLGRSIWVFRGAVTSFGVVSKEMAHSIQNCLVTCKISRLGNYQNLSYKQFSKDTQNAKLLLWSRCLWFCCALTTFRKVDIQEYVHLHRDFSARYILLLLGQSRLARQPPFRSRFRAVLSWIWLFLKMPMFRFAALFIIQAILYIWKK